MIVPPLLALDSMGSTTEAKMILFVSQSKLGLHKRCKLLKSIGTYIFVNVYAFKLSCECKSCDYATLLAVDGLGDLTQPGWFPPKVAKAVGCRIELWQGTTDLFAKKLPVWTPLNGKHKKKLKITTKAFFTNAVHRYLWIHLDAVQWNSML
jgi:hypothetical protein